MALVTTVPRCARRTSEAPARGKQVERERGDVTAKSARGDGNDAVSVADENVCRIHRHARAVGTVVARESDRPAGLRR